MEELQNMMFFTTRSNSTTSLQPKKKSRTSWIVRLFLSIHLLVKAYNYRSTKSADPTYIGPLDISETHGRCQNLLNWQRISPSPIIPAGNNAEFTH